MRLSRILPVTRKAELRAVLDKLRESEERYRALADAMPQIVWTADADGAFDYYNQRWFEYTGMTLEQTLGWGSQPSVLHTRPIGSMGVDHEVGRTGRGQVLASEEVPAR